MRYARLTSLFGFLVLAVSSALAQTGGGSGTATGSGTVPGAAPGATPSGGLANWWWLILIVLVAAAAIWYLRKGRGGRV